MENKIVAYSLVKPVEFKKGDRLTKYDFLDENGKIRSEFIDKSGSSSSENDNDVDELVEWAKENDFGPWS